MPPKIIYNAAFVCEIVAAVCCFMSFVSPYWIVSWPRVHSGFKKLGLWEACFAGNVIPNDPNQRAYHGCWWILAPEYWAIRSWLMPAWFVIVQILMTLTFLIHIVLVVMTLCYWLKCCKNRMEGCVLSTCAALQILNAIMTTIAIITFAIKALTDFNWMPNPNLNYLSWSFGLATLSAFFTIFSIIAMICYTYLVRNEMKAPPTAPKMVPMVPKV